MSGRHAPTNAETSGSRRYPGLQLFPQHEALLAVSGISPEVATARGYRSIDTKAALGRLGFSPSQRHAPGLLIPILSPVTGEIVLHQYRPDQPRCDSSGKPVKYETPTRARMAIDAHPAIRGLLGDPSVPLFVTEGVRKGDAAVSRGLCCVTLLGVWAFVGRNERGGKTVLPELLAIAVNGRQAFIAFDSDVMMKPQVHEAMRWLKGILEHRSARVGAIYLPSGPGGAKVGLDDFLAAGHSADDLLRLASPDLLQPVAERITMSLNGDRGPSHEPMSTPDLAVLERNAAAVREAPDPFSRIEQAIRAQGYGGDIGPAKLVHLGLTTRVLRMRPGAMPAHLLLVGPPSSGKNHALNVNLRLLPTAAYHLIDAGSPRVLIYDDADLRHRAVIFGEADSLPAGEDNPAASAIRNLLQDHHLHYKVTVRDPETGSFTVRQIDKPGPTILVTTATRRLGEQLESRLFVVEVPDDQQQLREALATQAAVELQGVPEPDQGVVAYQELLQAHAPWDVSVPFVKAISGALGRGPVAARVLRDFQKLLAFIKAATVLRHPRRRRDERGRLIATIEDYRTVYELVRDAYAATTTGAGAGVRRAVEAVAALSGEGKSPVAMLDVARRQGVHKSTASRHVRAALEGGWLINREERRGRYDLNVGDPLPQEGLPTPEEVERAYLPVTAATLQPASPDEPESLEMAPAPKASPVANEGATRNRATPPATAKTQTGRGVAEVSCTVAGVTERGEGPREMPPVLADAVRRWGPPVELRQPNGERRVMPDDEGRRVWLRAMVPERAEWILTASQAEIAAAVEALLAGEDAPA